MSSATTNMDQARRPAASSDEDRATAGVVYAYTWSAALWLLIGSAYGTIAAIELVWPDLLPYEWLSFGRIRPIHTRHEQGASAPWSQEVHRFPAFSPRSAACEPTPEA